MFHNCCYLGTFLLGICFEVYSPLGNPARPTKGESDPVVLEDPVINEIAKKHSATPAQVRLGK